MPVSFGYCEVAKKGENEVGDVKSGGRPYCLWTYYIT